MNLQPIALCTPDRDRPGTIAGARERRRQGSEKSPSSRSRQPRASPLLPLRRRLARHHLGGLKVHCGWLRRLSEYLWLLLLALERRLALRISFVALLFRLLLFLLLDEPRSDLVAEPLRSQPTAASKGVAK